MHDAPTVTGDRLGLIVGSSLDAGDLPGGAGDPPEPTGIPTPWGTGAVVDVGPWVVLSRHHQDGFTPAHLLDHHRTIATLCAAGCDRVLALASVGSLRGWPVGTVVVPFDFFAPQANPSFFDDARGHGVPGFDEPWRDAVIDSWHAINMTPLMDGGVYAQTRGPRFETPAEVRMLAAHADIVGMTIADECILAREAGLAYAALATVDNLANGLDQQALTVEDFHTGVAANRARLLDDLSRLLPRLAATPRPAPR